MRKLQNLIPPSIRIIFFSSITIILQNVPMVKAMHICHSSYDFGFRLVKSGLWALTSCLPTPFDVWSRPLKPDLSLDHTCIILFFLGPVLNMTCFLGRKVWADFPPFDRKFCYYDFEFCSMINVKATIHAVSHCSISLSTWHGPRGIQSEISSTRESSQRFDSG